MTSSNANKFVKVHFSWAKFGLKDASVENFYYSQWSAIPKIVYVGYRILMSVYFLIWLGMSVVDQRDGVIPETGQPFPKWYWVLKLTNWTFTLFNTYLIVSALNVTMNYIKTRKTQSTIEFSKETNRSLPILSRLHWLLFNMQAGMNLVVFIGFWTALVPFRQSTRDNLKAVSFHVHLINILATVGDIFMVAIPVNLAHGFFPGIFALTYISFSLIYWQAGGQPFPIYPPLDYAGKPAIAAGFILGMVLIGGPLIWLGIYSLSRLRIRLWERRKTQSTFDTELSIDTTGSCHPAAIHNGAA